ncbi:MAG: hypothetical protein LUD78_10795 [Clostridiales bacterium]|nr:hypothetical protein [Clostridiales bacterium]
MYTGKECFINDGKYLSESMLGFWQWAFSNINDNTIRGTLAEYIVRSALEHGGYSYNPQQSAWASYDLDGPILSHLTPPRRSRIEIKCSAYLQEWGVSNKLSFSIAPAKLLDENLKDYLEDSPRQRNNDLYVFAVYKAHDRRCNMLDLYWWEFYVLPTFRIENDPKLYKQKTISLKKLETLCNPVTYSDLCTEIVSVCNSITADTVHHFPSSPVEED